MTRPVLHKPNLIKRVLYRMGFRPSAGSIWYSPSLAGIYAPKDLGLIFERAYNEELARQKENDADR